VYLLRNFPPNPQRKSKLLRLYCSGSQSQQSFLLLSPSTHSLDVSTRMGHLQVNIFFEASYAFLTDPLLRLSLQIYHLL
jgi:hypothetical protein